MRCISFARQGTVNGLSVILQSVCGVLFWMLLAGFPSVLWALDVEEDTAEAPGGVFSLQVENDGLTDEVDGYYTHGSRLSYVSDGKAPKWLRDGAAFFPFFNQQGTVRASYALGQSIFTPGDLERSDLIEDDRPYAGWLYLGIGLMSDHKYGHGFFKNRHDSLELNFGIVGPSSQAEQVQDFSHRVRGAKKPNGWNHQLKDEPGLMLIYNRQWRAHYSLKLNGLGFDLSPHIGGALGNVMTYAAGGVTLRFGRHLGGDNGIPLIQPSLPGSGYFTRRPGFGWYLFAGAEGRAVLWNIFLDGNSYQDSHSVDKKPLVGDLQAGLVLTWEDYRLSFTSVYRSKEFDGQNSSTQYGSVSLSTRF